MRTIEVLPVGAEVAIGKKIAALVTAVMVEKRDKVTYRCAWWDGNNRHEEWLASFEVEANESHRQPIGFANGCV